MDSNLKHSFEIWLSNNGCEILPPTNEFELVRFRGRYIGVLYKSSKTSNKYTANALKCFLQKKQWNGGPIKYGRNNSYRKEKIAILERDGDLCFYCNKPLYDDITLEHIIPLNRGGQNILSNMVLTHEKCNQEAGNKTVLEKVNLAINKRNEF